MEANDKFHYSVLFTQTTQQERLKTIIETVFPTERGKVFIPCMEWWRRGKNEKEIRPLFPGYVFILSDMRMKEIHELLKKHRPDIGTFVRELGLSERNASGDPLEEEDGEYELTDLTKEETDFLNQMLNEEGIMEMSEGYSDKGKYFVQKGPLKAYEDLIVDVDRHNKMAYLNFSFRGRVTKAGMELFAKSHYFPKEKDVPMVLPDGSEIDLKELGKRMMGG